MAARLMFLQLKTGYDIDRGPSWICWVDFNRTWRTARVHGRVLERLQGGDDEGNWRDAASGEWFWLSGPKRDRTDSRYGPQTTTVDEDARVAYDAFLNGAPAPGRERG
jgi:hypothetical protein